MNRKNNMKQVWIDTDLAVGMKRYEGEGYSDVDDGYAILQLLKAKQVNIVGMSAVFGNTLLENAYKLCKYMSNEFSDGSIPVYKGAGEPIYLHQVETNEAVEALASALQKQPLTIMAIGPATNIGLLLLRYPELAEQITEIVLVAGRRTETDYFEIGTNGRRAPDLNVDLDNDAFRILFQFGINITLCPFEISKKVLLTQNDLDQLQQGDAGCRWLAENSQNWLEQWHAFGAGGFHPFDVLASHYILSPEDILSEKLNAHFEIHPDDRAPENERTHFKNFLLCNNSPGVRLTYCYDVVDDYHRKLMNSLLQ